VSSENDEAELDEFRELEPPRDLDEVIPPVWLVDEPLLEPLLELEVP